MTTKVEGHYSRLKSGKRLSKTFLSAVLEGNDPKSPEGDIAVPFLHVSIPKDKGNILDIFGRLEIVDEPQTNLTSVHFEGFEDPSNKPTLQVGLRTDTAIAFGIHGLPIADYDISETGLVVRFQAYNPKHKRTIEVDIERI